MNKVLGCNRGVSVGKTEASLDIDLRSPPWFSLEGFVTRF